MFPPSSSRRQTCEACILYIVVDLPANPFSAIMATRGSVCERICSLQLWDKWRTRSSSRSCYPRHVARFVYETNAGAPPKSGGRAFTSFLPLGVKKIKKGRNAVRYERRSAVGIHHELAGPRGLERRWLRPWSVVDCVVANTRYW